MGTEERKRGGIHLLEAGIKFFILLIHSCHSLCVMPGIQSRDSLTLEPLSHIFHGLIKL